MIRWSCVQTTSRLDRRASGITAAESLAIEDHLASCASCRETVALSDSFRALVEAQPSSMRQGTVERIMTRALDEGLAPRPRAPAPRRHLGLALATGAAVALVAVGVAMFRPRAPIVATVVPKDVVLAGSVAVDGEAVPIGEALPAGAAIRTEAGATLRAGPATLELSAGSEIVWTAGRATALLKRGKVAVVVDSRPGRVFRVSTDRFIVEVIGTRFSVARDEVRVSEGRVRVLDLVGSPLQTLGPGEVWETPQGTSAQGTSQDPAAEGASRAPPPHGDNVTSQLARARRHLARREVFAARRALSTALTLSPTRPQEADAATLAAECAFVEGKTGTAIRLYLAVVDRFPDLGAAESALFAAARLSDRGGRPDTARDLLVRYLDRYPRGQFQREAQARLRRIQGEETGK